MTSLIKNKHSCPKKYQNSKDKHPQNLELKNNKTSYYPSTEDSHNIKTSKNSSALLFLNSLKKILTFTLQELQEIFYPEVNQRGLKKDGKEQPIVIEMYKWTI